MCLQENALWLLCHILCDEASQKFALIIQDYKMLPMIQRFFNTETYSQNELFMYVVTWLVSIITEDLNK